jgi:pimeloyl-ACP methyl ester carboxylesterase
MSSGGSSRRTRMATFVLIPGAGSDSWSWHPATERLEAHGHGVIAVDLPTEDETAGLDRYVEVTLAAIEAEGGAPDELVVVGQSMGAFTAPIVADQAGARLLVLQCPMIPTPGETGGDWWGNVDVHGARLAFAAEQGRDAEAEDDRAIFGHDWPEGMWEAAEARHTDQSERPFADPWPLERWPDIPTRVILATNDRCFAPALVRRISEERLGITPDEVESGHVPALGNPDALVAQLEAYLPEVGLL